MFTFGQLPVPQSPASPDLVEALAQNIMMSEKVDYATARAMAEQQIMAKGAGSQAVEQAAPQAEEPNAAGAPMTPAGGYANPMAGYNGFGGHNTFGMPQASSAQAGQPQLAGQHDLMEADRLGDPIKTPDENKFGGGDALLLASSIMQQQQAAENAAAQQQANQMMEMLANAPQAQIIQGRYQPTGQQPVLGLSPLAGRMGLGLV